MKKIFTAIFVLTLSTVNCYADSLDNALNAQSRALNAGTVYGGVNTAAGVANTVSNIQTNTSIRRRMDTETALIKYQAAQEGIDLRDATDLQRERIALYYKSRYFLIHTKKQAKYEKDEEMLKLIKKYWKPWSTEDAIYAAEKVIELQEKRKKENSKL
jgi:hypothetical protein